MAGQSVLADGLWVLSSNYESIEDTTCFVHFQCYWHNLLLCYVCFIIIFRGGASFSTDWVHNKDYVPYFHKSLWSLWLLKALGVDAKHPLSKIDGCKCNQCTLSATAPALSFGPYVCCWSRWRKQDTTTHKQKCINRVLGVRIDPWYICHNPALCVLYIENSSAPCIVRIYLLSYSIRERF